MLTPAEHEAALSAALAALARHRPEAAARASAYADRWLASVRNSACPEHAWQASPLTGDGYPIEFAFSTADDDIRQTIAPWPDEPPHERLALAASMTESRIDLEALRRLQTGPLRYGVWVSGRHDGHRDRTKLYVEIASGAVPAGFSDQPAQARIEAVEPATGRTERYFRAERLQLHHLGQLLAEVDAHDRYTELRDAIESAAGRSIDAGLPGGSAGWSVARGPRRPPTLTVFVFAGALWGGDGAIRSGLLAFAAARGLDLGAYAEVSARLADRTGRATSHGLVGFVVAPGAPIHFTVGLRPPP
jgi:hypothetical protein